jgi:hypothetical protein
VIPHRCEVVDCRLLHGQTQADVEPVLAVLGNSDYELQWIEGRGSTRSARNATWNAIELVAKVERATVRQSAWPGSRTILGARRVRHGGVRLLPMRRWTQLASRLIHSTDSASRSTTPSSRSTVRHAAVEVTGGS